MPKSSLHTISWSEVGQDYTLQSGDQIEQRIQPTDNTALTDWLENQISFGFAGKAGKISLVKESRKRGGGYWYAYRNIQGQTRKHYLGPTPKITFSSLEQVVGELNHPTDKLELASEPSRSGLSLLASKLSPPRLPGFVVERPQLLATLSDISQFTLTLISASAGSGKTTLLATWVASQAQNLSNRIIAWLTLEELDNDSLRFWAALIKAVQTSRPKIGETALTMLYSPQTLPLSACLTALLSDIERLDEEVIVLLDDYHVISDPAIIASMQFLLDHLPSRLHLVLISRTDPDLPLARLRVRGQLLEIRDLDLSFSPLETNTFLVEGMKLPLSNEQITALQTRTEGWAAGLQLAALSLSKRVDVAAFLQDFTGSHRFVLDYMQDEILQHQPQAVQNFLLKVAILGRLNAALCEKITDEPASQAILENLERNNLFIVPLSDDRTWYRLHDLFREALLARLRQKHPTWLPRLHRQAADWYAACGEIEEALAHGWAASDYSFVAEILTREALNYWQRGKAQTILKWLLLLPDEILAQNARLALDSGLRLLEALQGATTSVYESGQELVEQLIARLTAVVSPQSASPDPASVEPMLTLASAEVELIKRRLSLLAGLLALRKVLTNGDLEEITRLKVETESLSVGEELNWKMVSVWINVVLNEAFQRRGAVLVGELQELKQQAIETKNGLVLIQLMRMLALAYLRAGQFQRVEQECFEALRLIGPAGQLTRTAALLHSFLGVLFYNWNRFDAAFEHFQEQLRISDTLQLTDVLVDCHLQIFNIELARGNLEAADWAIEQIDRQEQFSIHVSWVSALKAQYFLAKGDLRLARYWAERIEFSPQTPQPNQSWAILVLGKLYLAERRYQEAVEFLAQFSYQLDRPTENHPDTAEFLALYLVSLYSSGRSAEAQAVTVRLLAMTEQSGIVRVYLERGEPMREVLASLLAASSKVETSPPEFSRPYVLRLLTLFELEQSGPSQDWNAAYSAEPPQLPPVVEPLSRQEQQVLRLLSTGQTYGEIAGALFVSANTIKSQVSSIYRKLNVSRRAEAIAMAQQLSLL